MEQTFKERYSKIERTTTNVQARCSTCSVLYTVSEVNYNPELAVEETLEIVHTITIHRPLSLNRVGDTAPHIGDHQATFEPSCRSWHTTFCTH